MKIGITINETSEMKIKCNYLYNYVTYNRNAKVLSAVNFLAKNTFNALVRNQLQ